MRRTTFGVIIVIIGSMMMLRALGFADFDWFFSTDWKKFIFPGIIIIIGLKMIFSNRHRSHHLDGFKQCEIPEMGGNDRLKINASFTGYAYNFDRRTFTGANIDATLGGVNLDLRNAIINQDSTIDIHTFMGGVEIYLPNDVNIIVNSNSFAGGVNNKVSSHSIPEAKTIYINANCILGGVELK